MLLDVIGIYDSLIHWTWMVINSTHGGTQIAESPDSNDADVQVMFRTTATNSSERPPQLPPPQVFPVLWATGRACRWDQRRYISFQHSTAPAAAALRWTTGRFRGRFRPAARHGHGPPWGPWMAMGAFQARPTQGRLKASLGPAHAKEFRSEILEGCSFLRLTGCLNALLVLKWLGFQVGWVLQQEGPSPWSSTEIQNLPRL